MKFTAAIDEYLADMKAQGRINSPRTERSYFSRLAMHADDVSNRDPRERQVQEECWSLSHDDTHVAGELARAAAAYACPEPSLLDGLWPWEPRSFKPGSRMRDLAKAGALIVAEMERLSRRGGHGE